MEQIPLEQLLPKSGGSIYRLVRMASERALELSDGKRKLVENIKSDKLTTIALEEICQGKVVYSDVAENFVPAETNPDEEDQQDSE